MGILLASPKDSPVDVLGIDSLSPRDVCVVGVGYLAQFWKQRGLHGTIGFLLVAREIKEMVSTKAIPFRYHLFVTY